MWLLLGDDYFNTEHIAVIRPVSDGDQTVIFTAGQSAMDGGFLLDEPTDWVFEQIQNARLMEIAQALGETTEMIESEPVPVEPEPEED